jgi:SAM-dependent methyltransferase
MSLKDPRSFWQSISKVENWRDYILPRKKDEDFDYEGSIEVHRLFYFFDGSSTVVDYGCGIGRVLKYVSERAKVAMGLDINPDFLEKAKAYVKNDKVLFFNSDEYHQENVADLVYSLMVLQHNDQENRERIMHHIFRILKPGGLALINFPRFESNYYEENGFLHKFTRSEVEQYGRLFSSFRIIEGNLPNYVLEYDKKMSHEYFLIAVKQINH